MSKSPDVLESASPGPDPLVVGFLPSLGRPSNSQPPSRGVRLAERQRLDRLLRIPLLGWGGYLLLFALLGRFASAVVQLVAFVVVVACRSWALRAPVERRRTVTHLVTATTAVGIAVNGLLAGLGSPSQAWFLVAVPIFVGVVESERAALAWGLVVLGLFLGVFAVSHSKLLAPEFVAGDWESLLAQTVITLIVLAFVVVARRADDDRTRTIEAEIRERIHALSGQAAAEQRFRALFEHVADAQLILASGGRDPFGVSDCNLAAVRLLGADDKHDVVERGLSDFWAEQQLDGRSSGQSFAAHVARARERGEQTFEWTFSRADGSQVPVAATLSVVELDDGRAVLLGCHDLTVRRRADERLRQSEERHRATLRAIPDLMFRVRADGTYLDYKPRSDPHEPVSGVPSVADRFVGRNLREGPLPPDVRRRVVALVEEALVLGEPRLYEYELEGFDGVERHEARIVPSGRGEAVCIVRDVTEQKAVERMKDEFISILSHELRTPLTSIRGSLGLLEAGVVEPLGEKASELVTIARGGCERLIRLVNDILDLERLGASRLELDRRPCSPAELLGAARAELVPLAELAGVELAVQVPSDIGLRCVEVDRDRMLQVLNNLLSNAIKHAPAGSMVVLGAEMLAGGKMRFTVHDDGPGISPVDRPKLFRRFQQLGDPRTRTQGGTGLGLAISKGIVEQHGGYIDVASAPGGGTTFFVELDGVA